MVSSSLSVTGTVTRTLARYTPPVGGETNKKSLKLENNEDVERTI